MTTDNINYNDDLIKELHKAEEEIKNNIKKPSSFKNNNFIDYALIDSNWLEKYLALLKDSKNIPKEKNLYKIDNLFPKEDERDYSYIDSKMIFNIPINFSFLTTEAMTMISEFNDDQEEKKNIKDSVDYVLVGGECIIIRGDKNLNFIIVFEENKNNNFDYILMLKFKEERDKARDYILRNNIWNFLKKIKFTEKDEYKEIFDEENRKLGFIVRSGSLKRIEQLKQFEKEKIKFDNNLKKDKSRIRNASFDRYNSKKKGILKNNFNTNNINNLNNFKNMNNINMNNLNNNPNFFKNTFNNNINNFIFNSNDFNNIQKACDSNNLNNNINNDRYNTFNNFNNANQNNNNNINLRESLKFITKSFITVIHK